MQPQQRIIASTHRVVSIADWRQQHPIQRYRIEQRELEAERERLDRTIAALQVSALLHRAGQPEPCSDEDSIEDEPPIFTRGEIVFFVVIVALSITLFVARITGRLA
jgi:hypothetical protein